MGAAPYRGEGGLASGGEYHNALEPFLGPPTKKIDVEPHMSFPHEAWFLPDAYSGRNDYIRETIVQMVINYNAFMTREILPWREQDNPNIAWDSIKFDKTLIDMEPEQGIPRYVTVEREAHTDYMVRRGLALIVNHGFAATPGGQKDFMYKVATIAGAVQETCDQAGVIAILRAKNEYRSKVVEDMKSAGDAYDLFHHELWRWGIIQHTERGWYHMDAEAQHVMRCENIQPDTWIVPPRMTSFAAMGQMAETEVWRAGEATARGNLLRGEDNFATFRGKSVYEIKPYQLDVDGRVVDPLNRSRMIGDFFVIPCYDIAKDGDGPAYPRYGKGRTQVYCCESDSFETFSWQDVVNKSEFHLLESGSELPDDVLRNELMYNGDAANPRQRALLMIKALATHKKMRDGMTQEQVDETYDDAQQLAEACRQGLPFLAPVLKAGDVSPKPGEGDKLPSRPHLRPYWLSNSRFGPAAQAENHAASQALRAAVESGIRFKYDIPATQEVTDPQVAANTYAETLVKAGFTAAQAAPVMLDAIHECIAANIDSHHSYIEPVDLSSAPMQHTHDAYVNGDREMSALELAIDQGTGHAMRALASAGGRRKTKNVKGKGPKQQGTNEGLHSLSAEELQYLNQLGESNESNEEAEEAKVVSPAPFDLLCIRPFRQYTMGTGVLCKKGNELGNTFRGWADFQLTDNIIAKTHIGHFTFWHASIVTNPKCLFLAEDIFCTNYEAGENRNVLSWQHAHAFREDPIGTMRMNSASIIAMPVPVGAISPFDHRLVMNNPISITGSLDPNVRELTGRQDACKVHIGDYESNGSTYETLKELHSMWTTKHQHLTARSQQAMGAAAKQRLGNYVKANPAPPKPQDSDTYSKHLACGGQVLSDIYDAIWNFSGMNHAVDYQNSGSFETSARLINTMCFHTMQKFQNPQNMRWEVSNLNTGHFGENGIYEGVKKIRCGFLDYFKEMNYQKAMAMGGHNI